MNKKALQKSIGHHVHIRPIARRFDREGELPLIDDEWLIQRVSGEGVQILNVRTRHAPVLGFDHIFGYSTDPDRSVGGVPHGQLTLLVQLVLQGNEVFKEPTQRPGEPNLGPIIFGR